MNDVSVPSAEPTGPAAANRDWAVDALSVWAVRYALGRMTYAVGHVVDTLIASRDAITHQSRRVICRDIDEAIVSGQYGMDMDREQWQRLRDYLDVPCSHFPGQTKCDWCRNAAASAEGGSISGSTSPDTQ